MTDDRQRTTDDRSGTFIRAFVALELPEEVRHLLAAKQDELQSAIRNPKSAIRWSRPVGVHLTLQFLGDVPAELIPKIGEAVREGCAGSKAFRLALGRSGSFPNSTKPRVLWIGLEGDVGQLQQLQANVAAQLKTLGYEPDKAFKPHVTLGRVRDTVRPDELRVISAALREQESQPVARRPFVADTVSLMQSHLQTGGSVYTPLATVELNT